MEQNRIQIHVEGDIFTFWTLRDTWRKYWEHCEIPRYENNSCNIPSGNLSQNFLHWNFFEINQNYLWNYLFPTDAKFECPARVWLYSNENCLFLKSVCMNINYIKLGLSASVCITLYNVELNISQICRTPWRVSTLCDSQCMKLWLLIHFYWAPR